MLIAAEEELLQCGFRVLLRDQPWIGGCFVASAPGRALVLVRRERVDVAVIGVRVGTEPGLELSERLLAVSPQTRVLLIDPDLGISPFLARAAGATGLISRSWPAGDLIAAIRAAAAGTEVFPPAKSSPAELSPRELEIVGQIATGSTNREIADRMFLSPNTVKQHASALYRKLGARNRAEAVRRAQHLGLIG